MLLPIVTEPNQILHTVAEDLTLEEIKEPKFKKFVTNMIETMYLRDGVGLAAPQVNISKQICVISKAFSPTKKELVLINPVWQKLSILKTTDAEGCLSVPNTSGEVKRYKKIKIKALDLSGKPIEFIANNYLARIIQHEVDHLNGILFIEKAKNLRHIENV